MHKKADGNILFVTMILLIVSSIMGLLIVYYMKAMIGLTSNFHDYFQAYYRANGGVEIGLTQIVARQSYGFEKTKNSYTELLNGQKIEGNAIFPSNGDEQQSRNNTVGFIKSFGRIYADDYVYGEGGTCDGLNFKNLSQGEPILIPLYYDDSPSTDSQKFNQVEINEFKSEGAGSLTLSIIASGTVQGKVIEGEIDSDFLVKSSESSENKTISNNISTPTQITITKPASNFIAFLKTNPEPGSVCIEFSKNVPLPFYLVSSTSVYGRTRIVLQGYKKNERIGEFLYTAIASNTTP